MRLVLIGWQECEPTQLVGRLYLLVVESYPLSVSILQSEMHVFLLIGMLHQLKFLKIIIHFRVGLCESSVNTFLREHLKVMSLVLQHELVAATHIIEGPPQLLLKS